MNHKTRNMRRKLLQALATSLTSVCTSFQNDTELEINETHFHLQSQRKGLECCETDRGTNGKTGDFVSYRGTIKNMKSGVYEFTTAIHLQLENKYVSCYRKKNYNIKKEMPAALKEF